MKRLHIVVLVFSVLYAQQPTAARFWGYGNMTAVLAANWAFVVMPGLRYEFARSDDAGSPARNLYFTELLTGPVYVLRSSSLTVKFPLWYYYMGFPMSGTDDYFYSHNIEFLPIVEYRLDRLKLTSRTIFHNTVYASIYETGALRNGYGLVVRQMFRADYNINNTLSVTAAGEPFFGVIEDSEAPPHVLGFWPGGFQMNRLYVGIELQVSRVFTISPQYVFETTYNDDGELSGINHYLHITLTCTMRM